MSWDDYYPMGTNGSDDDFNQPDPPEPPECYELPDRGEFLCPACEWQNECAYAEVDDDDAL